MNTLSWQAPEYERTERTASWYLWSILGATLLVIIALWQKNILFALFVILAEGVLLLMGREKSPLRLYHLDESGLSLDNKQVRAYPQMLYFSFFDFSERYVELIIRPTERFHFYTRVLLPRERVQEVQAFLEPRVHAFEYRPTMADILARWMRL
jgi:hypothetical protein